MTRVLVVLLLAGFGTFAPPAAQGPPSRDAKPQLRISVVALDRDGQPVADLTKNDLEVWIGGYRIPIETLTVVSPADNRAGRVMVLLLDDTTVPPERIPRLKEIARRFVNRMAPGDEMAIVGLNADAMELSSDRTRLLRAIDSAGLLQAAGVQRLEDVGAHVLGTITALSRRLVERPGGRKTIVGLGSAWLFDTPIPPPIGGRSLRPEWTGAMRATASAGVHVYAIDPAGVGDSPLLNGASGFARETGGHTFLNTNDFDRAVDRIMQEASTYYEVAVADPPVRRTSDLRELDVRALRRGITVRARRAIPGRP